MRRFERYGSNLGISVLWSEMRHIFPPDKERIGGERLVGSKTIAIQTELRGPDLVLKVLRLE